MSLYLKRCIREMKAEGYRGDWLPISVALHHVEHLLRGEPPCLWCGMFLAPDFTWRPEVVEARERVAVTTSEKVS